MNTFSQGRGVWGEVGEDGYTGRTATATRLYETDSTFNPNLSAVDYAL
ncbi:MAG: hypothetical protein K8L91_01395 [Anaerolineae bacterium]|nr:hypothetical protein [Anaerolineae bacterium]